MKGIFGGFKEFVLRGNAIDLAVGVVIGAAFGAVVTAVVDHLITPLIGAIFGAPDLSRIWDITLRVNPGDTPDAIISVGGILNAILQFLLIAIAVYFVIVLPMNKLAERRAKGLEPEPEAPSEDVVLLTEIRDLLAKQ
ncbi:MAG: large conductance mechanosensitive channel protein MscL [Actinomycetales bacterium]|nr:large conductance mechanosensitive channel protein MscL [Actinomycetales bacterium]